MKKIFRVGKDRHLRVHVQWSTQPVQFESVVAGLTYEVTLGESEDAEAVADELYEAVGEIVAEKLDREVEAFLLHKEARTRGGSGGR